MAIRADSVTPPTVSNRMSGCAHLDIPRVRFDLHPSEKYVILLVSRSLVWGCSLFDAHDKEDEGAGRCHTRCRRSLAGLISTGHHTDPKAPHRRRILRFAAEESCW
jgi:hypothetical protein